MVTLNAHFDGKTIVPDEPLALPPNQKLRVTIETIDATDEPAAESDESKWQLGSQPDLVLFSPHADAAVPLMIGSPLDERDALHIDPLAAVPADFVRTPGSGAGEIQIADDFDDTPPGFKDYA